MEPKYLTHENEVFNDIMTNLDLMIERTVGNMIMRNADESTITLKIGISLDKKTVPSDNGSYRELTQPSFKHDLSSVMTVKDKMSGTFKGNVELIFDEKGKPILRDIDDGQMQIWEDTYEEVNDGPKSLPAPSLPEVEEYTDYEESDDYDYDYPEEEE